MGISHAKYIEDKKKELSTEENEVDEISFDDLLKLWVAELESGKRDMMIFDAWKWGEDKWSPA